MGRKPKSAAVEGPSTTTDTVSPLETTENERHKEISGSTPSKKNATKGMNVFVRRSCRLKNVVSPAPNNGAVSEEIDLVDSDGQDTRVEEQLTNELKEPHIGELGTEPTWSQGDMDEKIDFLVQSVQEFKSMLRKRNYPNRQKSEELNYEDLYIDSRRKIDSLIEENHELTKKLEFARGKAEAYEQMKDAFGNFKETMQFSHMAKFAEAVFNISSQAGTAANCSLPVVGSPAHPPPAPPNNNNDNLRVVLCPPPAANVDEPKTSPEKNQRGRKKTKV